MSHETVSDIEAAFGYLRDPPTDAPGEAIKFFSEDPQATTMRVTNYNMLIRDGRKELDSYSLDVQGFALVKHQTAARDFLDVRAIEKSYEQEMVELVKQTTGAAQVLTFGVNVRFAKRPSRFVKLSDDQPARFTHSDFTPQSSETLIAACKGVCPEYRRAAIYNIWRAVTPPPQDWPLAVCDYRSTALKDEMQAQVRIDVMDVPAQDAVMTVYKYNPEHKWVYFSDMTIDEALIFKAYDTDETRPQRIPHSSFINPLAGENVTPRGSIEARAVAFFQ